MSNAKWKIVPVVMTYAQREAICNDPEPDIRRDYATAVAFAPEPDWEALANVAARAFRHAPAGDRTGAWIAALKATFGSKP